MALITKEGKYIRIDMINSFININGVYIAYDVYSSVEDRDKDKERFDEMLQFFENVTKMDQDLIENPRELDEEEALRNHYALFVRNNLNRFTQVYEGTIKDELTDEILQAAEAFGFKREWYEDPVKLEFSATNYTKKYEKDDITYENFYNILKNTIFTESEDHL